MTSSTRLYLSPFSQDSFSTIIPTAIRPLVSDCSFHALQTHPEQGFGFLNLPTDEASLLRRKLNGSFLRGTRLRVEEARPQPPITQPDTTTTLTDEVRFLVSSKPKSNVKRKIEGIIEGTMLPKGRTVKRGWTQDQGESHHKRSHAKIIDHRANDGKKMVFRSASSKEETSRSPCSGVRKSKMQNKTISKRSSTQLVTEFQNTVQYPSFLRTESAQSPNAASASEYIDGKGWVDDEGNIVEPEKTRRPTAKTTNVEQPQALGGIQGSKEALGSKMNDVSTYGSPRTADNEDAEDLSGRGPAIGRTGHDDQIHPLEALYKKPKIPKSSSSEKRPAPIQTTFSFFGDEEVTERTAEDPVSPKGPAFEPLHSVPQTPFTRLDFERRVLRSAAPTPDTAAIGRSFSFSWTGDSEDDSSHSRLKSDGGLEELGSDTRPGVDDAQASEHARGATKQATDFEKHFWASRGDYNRSWKARKREARKERRQDENKRLNASTRPR